MSAEKAEIQRKKALRRSNRKGHIVDPRTIEAAGYLMVLTSHPAQAVSASAICEAYRNPWQVETGIKRGKSLGGLDKLRAKAFELGRSWFLTQLFAAIMTDELANEIAGFAPRPLAPSTPDAPNVSLPPQAESSMETTQDAAQSAATNSGATIMVEAVQATILSIEIGENDTLLSIKAPGEPTSTTVIEDKIHAPDQTKSEKRVAADRPAKASAAQKGKRQMSFWRAWALAREMLLRAITPNIVEFTQAQLKRVQKALSELPRNRVNRGNALRPVSS